MLVLSRKQGETLVIGGNITIKVIQLQGGAVRLGIEAPRDVSVHRAEVHQRLEARAVESRTPEVRGRRALTPRNLAPCDALPGMLSADLAAGPLA